MKAFRLWLRWVFANSMGEMVGLGLTFGLGYLIIFYLGEMAGIWGTLLSFGLMVATSVVEGTVVGIAQFWGMHPLVHRPDDHRLGIKQGVWIRATILGALVAWFFGALPYDLANARLLHRAIFWAASREQDLKKWFCSNLDTDCAFYPKTGRLVVVNNLDQPQTTTVFDGHGKPRKVTLKAHGSRWLDGAT